MAQLDSIQKLKPKYSVRKGRRLRTKQLVVERELNLMPKANSSGNKQTLTNAEESGLSDTQIVDASSTNIQPLANTEEHCVAETQTVQCEIEHFVDHVLYTPENNIHHSIEEKREPTIALQHSNIGIGLELSSEIPIVETSNNFSALLHDSSRSLSPSGILKEDQWISSEVGDFSLSSFLGHLESPMKSQDDSSHDVDAQVRSLLTENSFDYTAKFADLAKKVKNDTPI
ncbi:hypothetical protein WA026_002131 [Henosepilachna vigintioctopunctata]|uniref:Uncharacterized protein n=1 Tax=Henosepilachna vigintioctopunctata TaxID=420089 RepID=A0AAW1TZJ7_9CUCU